jgi:ketosteroid isomerase-like protein
MRKLIFIALSPAVVLAMSCNNAPPFNPDVIIAMERAALDRWGKGDPQGYLEIMAPEITYFDPNQEKRVDGQQAMKDLLLPIAGKVSVARYQMIEPRVQRHGNAAVLTFNLVSYVKTPKGEEVPVRWNSTEVYGWIDGAWKLIHSHWSYVKPDLKQPTAEIGPN